MPLYASTLRGGLRFQFLGSMLVFGGVPVPCFSVMGRLVSSGLCGRDLLLFGGFERQKKKMEIPEDMDSLNGSHPICSMRLEYLPT